MANEVNPNNNNALNQYAQLLVEQVNKLTEGLKKSFGSIFDNNLKSIRQSLGVGNFESVTKSCMTSMEKFNTAMEKIDFTAPITFIISWLKTIWAKLKQLPSQAGGLLEKIKANLQKFSAKMNEYWQTIKNGTNGNDGLKNMWAKNSTTYKVLFVIGIILFIVVLSYLLIKPDMLEDTWKEFSKAMTNIKNGIAKAFKQGTFMGVIKGIFNIFLAPFKVIMAGITALIDSGIGDLLVICLFFLSVSAVFMYFKITGKKPFETQTQAQARICKEKLISKYRQLMIS